MTDSSDRYDAQARHDAFASDEEKRIAIAQDGQPQVVGQDDTFARTDAAAPAPISKDNERRQSRGWGFGRMMGAKS
jgi:hypothetical protein